MPNVLLQLLESFQKYPYVPYARDDQSDIALATAASAPSSAGESASVAPPLPIPSIQNRDLDISKMRVTEDGKQVPIGNGGYTERYYWTQTLKEVTVFIDIVEPNVRGKDVQCVIKPRQISLSVRGQEYLNGEMEDAVKVDESMWTMVTADGKSQVIITLDKTRHTWWKHVVVGDPVIDTSKVI
jgi:hypothetical protein